MKRKKRKKRENPVSSDTNRDQDISHKKMYDRFFPSDGEKMQDDLQNVSDLKDSDDQKNEEIVKQEHVAFVWYEEEGPDRNSGLGKSNEVWEEGMIIELSQGLRADTTIRLLVKPECDVKSNTAVVVSCIYKNEDLYQAEVRFL